MLLSVANSPAFAAGTALSLEQCLQAIGPRLVRTLAASMAIQYVHARSSIFERNSTKPSNT